MIDKARPNSPAPMPSAPMKYKSDGLVDWANMWDAFCALPQDGGPPHRGTMLHASQSPDENNPAYRRAAAEIARGVAEVSGLAAKPAQPGWLAVQCSSPEMARWLAEAICSENVEAYARDSRFFVPVDHTFALKGEIKNVITAVAKTTHYWQEHLPVEVKRTLRLQSTLSDLWRRCKQFLNRS